MKNSLTTAFWAASLLVISNLQAPAQLSPAGMLQAISDNTNINSAQVYDLYARLNYQPIWLINGNTVNRDDFFHLLHQAPALGLNQKDYHPDIVNQLQNNPASLGTMADSLKTEVLLTDAAVHYFTDLAYGNRKPEFGYYGLAYNPGCYTIPELIKEHLLNQSLSELPAKLASRITEIKVIEEKLTFLYSVVNSGNFQDYNISQRTLSYGRKQIMSRLFQLGVAPDTNEHIPDSIFIGYIKEFQLQCNLKADGVIGTSTINQFNIPLATRIKQLSLAVNYYRWLYCLQHSGPVIVVNIPAAILKVYSNEYLKLHMRIIVGKKSTPTPTLASTVDEVILYPYWHVPKSIAVNELLPKIRAGSNFLDKGNYQVLDQSGKVINPNTVNWQALSRADFPYIIRQGTGCDNSLGLLKINFYNPFSVYLHDTPNKNLFKQQWRYFSHGCMRMQNPAELAHLVLYKNTIAVDTLEQAGCVRNQAPVVVPADEKMPVIVWYNPVEIDETGRIIFYEDVYNKFRWQQQ